MDVNELYNKTANALIKKIQATRGLTGFAKRRAKFEGWLKVEIIDALINNEYAEALPEVDRIDVTIEKLSVAIELKTINTNYRYENVDILTRPIKDNIDGIIRDIKQLRINDKYDHKFIVFIAFPTEHNKPKWQEHLSKINPHIKEGIARNFKFCNNVPAVIYYGKIAKHKNNGNTGFSLQTK
jgi:hypothetical protein